MNEAKAVKLIRFDWAIKNILRNKANFDVLEGFLSELLKKQVTIESLLESEANQDRSEAKFNRVDLMVRLNNDERVIVEVQSASQWDFWHRILFGTAKVVTEYLEKGDCYSNISKVISVSILFFTLGKGTDYIYKGTTDFLGLHNNEMLELNHEQTDLYVRKNYKLPRDIFPEYYIIQLTSFKNIIQDKFDEWVYLLKNDTIKPEFNAQGVISAKKKLDVLKLSPAMRAKYENDMLDASLEASLIESKESEMRKAIADAEAKIASAEAKIAEGEAKIANAEAKIAEGEAKIANAEAKVANAEAKIAEGEAKGRAEGELSGILKTAKAMLDKKIPIDTVCEITGLRPEQLLSESVQL